MRFLHQNREPPPVPTDQVARQLMMTGARREALALLRAAVLRDDHETACAVLLRALDERPSATPSSPGVALDIEIVERFIRRGMLVEALALLCGSSLKETGAGAAWAAVLAEVLAPPPAGSELVLREVYHQLVSGGATVALTLLEERAARSPLGSWAGRRLSLLRWLLLENAPKAQEPNLVVGGSTDLARALSEQVAKRNIRAARDAAKGLLERNPGDIDARMVVGALDRLVGHVTGGDRPADDDPLVTGQMDTRQAAYMQLVMCNFDAAEQLFRKVTVADPTDVEARRELEDVRTVRTAIAGRRVSPAEPPRIVQPPAAAPFFEDEHTDVSMIVDVEESELSTVSPLAANALGAAFDQEITFDAGRTLDDLSWEDASTSRGGLTHEDVGKVALSAGRFEEALRIYAGLAAKHPDQERFRSRLKEIVDQIDRNSPAGTADVTVERTVPAELKKLAMSTGILPKGEAVRARILSRSGTHERQAVVVTRIVSVGRSRA